MAWTVSYKVVGQFAESGIGCEKASVCQTEGYRLHSVASREVCRVSSESKQGEARGAGGT